MCAVRQSPRFPVSYRSIGHGRGTALRLLVDDGRAEGPRKERPVAVRRHLFAGVTVGAGRVRDPRGERTEVVLYGAVLPLLASSAKVLAEVVDHGSEGLSRHDFLV